MECYLLVKRNHVLLIHATLGMNLENSELKKERMKTLNWQYYQRFGLKKSRDDLQATIRQNMPTCTEVGSAFSLRGYICTLDLILKNQTNQRTG